MSLSAREKVRLVRALDDLGIHFIEAGFPSSNPKEAELFELLRDVELRTSTIAAFGMTRRRDIAAAEDPALQTLAATFAPARLPCRQDLGPSSGEGHRRRPPPRTWR